MSEVMSTQHAMSVRHGFDPEIRSQQKTNLYVSISIHLPKLTVQKRKQVISMLTNKKLLNYLNREQLILNAGIHI